MYITRLYVVGKFKWARFRIYHVEILTEFLEMYGLPMFACSMFPADFVLSSFWSERFESRIQFVAQVYRKIGGGSLRN